MIAKAGKPLAKLTRLDRPERTSRRLGFLAGQARIPDDFDVDPRVLRRALIENGYSELAVTAAHAAAVAARPFTARAVEQYGSPARRV